jgi:hypothetical protein
MGKRLNMPFANCLAEGKLSPSIEGWPGAPICREHVATFIANHQPTKILPPPGGFAPSTAELQ